MKLYLNRSKIILKRYQVTKKNLATAALCFLLSGCASNKNLTSQHSGFLSDYSSLKQSPYDPAEFLYIAPGVDFASYENVMVAPVRIMANNEQIKANKSLLKEMSEYMTQKVRTSIRQNPNFKLVTKPQANTAKIEFALTAVTVDYSDREVYQYIPVAFVITEAARASGASDKNARVVVELRVTDANTGQVLGRVLGSQKGEQVTVDQEKKLTLDLLKPALDNIAKRVNKRLTEMKKKIKK